jgi:hypothetical protein
MLSIARRFHVLPQRSSSRPPATAAAVQQPKAEASAAAAAPAPKPAKAERHFIAMLGRKADGKSVDLKFEGEAERTAKFSAPVTIHSKRWKGDELHSRRITVFTTPAQQAKAQKMADSLGSCWVRLVKGNPTPTSEALGTLAKVTNVLGFPPVGAGVGAAAWLLFGANPLLIPAGMAVSLALALVCWAAEDKATAIRGWGVHESAQELRRL